MKVVERKQTMEKPLRNDRPVTDLLSGSLVEKGEAWGSSWQKKIAK